MLGLGLGLGLRSEEHTSELQSPDCISYAVFCFKKIFFNDTATTEIYTLSLHDALPISNPSFSPSPTPTLTLTLALALAPALNLTLNLALALTVTLTLTLTLTLGLAQA